jgi:hypothetical protein
MFLENVCIPLYYCIMSAQKITDYCFTFTEEGKVRLLFLRCKGNLKKVQESLNTYYSMKTNRPDIHADTDPLKPWFKETAELRYAKCNYIFCDSLLSM